MENESTYRRRYSFGPMERRGIAGGLRGGQIALLAAGAGGALCSFVLAPGSAGLVGGVAAVSIVALLAFLPIRGRTLEEWAPAGGGHLWRSIRGRLPYRSAIPGAGVVAALDGADARLESDLPPALNGCEILSFEVADGREVGIFRDGMRGTLTAVMAVRVRAFGLLSEPEQERRLERWGQALASLARAGSIVRRVQILERTVPADGDVMQRYLVEARDDAMDPDAFPRRSYEALLDAAGFITQDHELFLTLQVKEHTVRSRRRQPGPSAAAAALVREIDALASRFDPSDVVVEGVLTPRMVARTLRLAYDPFGRERLNRLAAAAPDFAGADPSAFGPIAADERWDSYRTDGAVHRTYWVAQWPRLAVGPTFLAPLLLSADVVRSLSVVLEPVSPNRARRAVEAAITSDQADEELRAERGFRTTARQRKRQEAVLRREQELATGHQEFRFAGFVTVSASDERRLELACEQVEQSAHQAYLDLQPLWGEQDIGFTFGALPIGRGLRPAGLLTGGSW